MIFLRMQPLRLVSEILFLSQEITNTVKIKIDTNEEEYIIDPSGLQTLTASYEYPPRLLEFNLPSAAFANHDQIYEILCQSHSVSHELSWFLRFHIANMATHIQDIGVNCVVLNLDVKLTYARFFYSGSNFSDLEVDDVVGRLVMEGKIDEEISKNLDLESEPCSICFENLSGTIEKTPTRMSCSHVFHDRCISQWLRRKNSCPLCREVLYAGR